MISAKYPNIYSIEKEISNEPDMSITDSVCGREDGDSRINRGW